MRVRVVVADRFCEMRFREISASRLGEAGASKRDDDGDVHNEAWGNINHLLAAKIWIDPPASSACIHQSPLVGKLSRSQILGSGDSHEIYIHL